MIEKNSLTPPWTTLGKTIESKVRKALFDFDQVQDRIAVALSGGKDSITLLLMLKAISGRGFPPFKLHAFHVSGEFSCGGGVTTGFLKEICALLDVPLTIRESTKTLDDLECYSCSRERRSLLFAAAKQEGFNTIAFGHHQDDNAQTVLMNLLHKAEFCGNHPKIYMYDFQVTIIRPLIYVTEQETREFAKLQGFLRAVCRCPVGQNSMRKKAEQFLQELERVFPNARGNLAKSALQTGKKSGET